MSKPKHIELLSPAGNMERLRFALHYGADAVYLSGQAFGLRAFADNFTPDGLKEAIAYAHARGKKAYVTVNCFAREAELGPIGEWLAFIHAAGADAAIVSEAGVIRIAKRFAPDLPLHLSTQASTLNSEAVLFWRDQGIKRIILARELSRGEIAAIRNACKDIELETFVHGAMCIAYSGRCVLSNYMTNGEREGNAGACTQPCRWEYDVVERKRPGEYMPVKEDARGTYVFNSRDLMLMEHVGELMDIGVDSLKIEGRMKSVLYAATVTTAYRRAMDAHLSGGIKHGELSELKRELCTVSHRPYTTAYYLGDFTPNQHIDTAAYSQDAELSAIVLEYDAEKKAALISQRNRFFVGDELELVSPNATAKTLTVRALRNMEGESVQSAPHPEERLWLYSDLRMENMDLLRKRL